MCICVIGCARCIHIYIYYVYISIYTWCKRSWIKRHRYTLAFVCIFHRKGDENATGFNILLYRYNCVRQREIENVIIKSCPSFDAARGRSRVEHSVATVEHDNIYDSAPPTDQF